MRPDDVGVVADMIKSLYQNLGAPDGYMNDGKIKLTFDQLFKHPGSIEVDVFEFNGQIAGYALLFSYWYNEFGGRVLNIDELFVKEEFRGQRMAKDYLSALLSRKEFVAHTLEVLPENENAYALYRKSGFEKKETITLARMLEM